MGVTPVCALNTIKRDGIGGVANNPVVFRILQNDVADSSSSTRLTSLAEDFLIKVLYKELYITIALLPVRRFQSRLH